MQRFICSICGHIYDPAHGEATLGISPGTDFPVLPADFACPVCGASKVLFKPETEGS